MSPNKTSAKALPAKTSRTLAIKRRQPAPAPAPPAPAAIEVPELEPVLISRAEVQSVVMEIAAIHVQMQEHGHDLIGLLRATAKNAYGIDLPALPIEIAEDDLNEPGEYTSDQLGLTEPEGYPYAEETAEQIGGLERRVAALEVDVKALQDAVTAPPKKA